MLQQITFIILTVGQPHIFQDVVDKNFALIEDFRRNQMLFSSDTFDLVDQSSDGGELIAFYNKDKDYLVFDIWLFGETGKIHATYWTDKNLDPKIVKRTDFKYDKPYYEKGYKGRDTTEYLSFSKTSVRRYSADQTELKDPVINAKKIESENFFKDVTKGLNILK